jgi:hypothetical protein
MGPRQHLSSDVACREWPAPHHGRTVTGDHDGPQKIAFSAMRMKSQRVMFIFSSWRILEETMPSIVNIQSSWHKHPPGPWGLPDQLLNTSLQPAVVRDMVKGGLLALMPSAPTRERWNLLFSAPQLGEDPRYWIAAPFQRPPSGLFSPNSPFGQSYNQGMAHRLLTHYQVGRVGFVVLFNCVSHSRHQLSLLVGFCRTSAGEGLIFMRSEEPPTLGES